MKRYFTSIIYSFFIIGLIMPTILYGQSSAYDASFKEPIREFKVLHEYSEGKYDVSVVQYKQGNMRVKETIYRPKVTKVPLGINVAVDPKHMAKDQLVVIVDKSDYTVEVLYYNKPIRSYRAVFGPNPMADKCMEGDRCTPEGTFTISGTNPSSRYHRFLLLNYPTNTHLSKFNALKSEGKIPADAHIGKDIGIHGIWQGGDDLIEMGVGWTDGCIALKNKDIEDLFSLVGVGTKVIIHK